MLARLTIVLGLVLASCGGDDASFVPQGASDYCEAIEPFFCDFYLRCGRMDVDTVAECKKSFLVSCNSVFEPRYVGLETAGLLELDLEGLAACKAHLDTVTCSEKSLELTGPCAGMWRGTQPTGAACGFDVESFTCAPGNECVLGLDLCGTCREVIAVGATCTPGTDTCGAEGFCDEGSCVARVPNGGACTPDDRCMTGASCTNGVCTIPTYVARGETCDQQHRCPYLTVCTGRTCQPTSALGEACTNDGVCELGFCDAGVCELPRDVGAPCDRPNACSSGLCEGTCQARPSSCIAD